MFELNESKSPPQTLLLDMRQTAKALSLSERTIGSLIKEGSIPSLKIRGRRLFSVESLRRWIDKRMRSRSRLDAARSKRPQL